MTAALPVLVECSPYKAKLTAESCAARYKVVNAPGAKDPIVLLRAGKCGGCSVGRDRLDEIKDQVPTLVLKSVESMLLTPGQTKRASAASRAARDTVRAGIRAGDEARKRDAKKPVSVQTDKSPTKPVHTDKPEPKEEMATKSTSTKPAAILRHCQNPACTKTFVPKRKKQETCSKPCYLALYHLRDGQKPKPPSTELKNALDKVFTTSEGRKELTPLQRWFALREVLQERKRVAAEAIASAEKDLEAHVDEHPEVIHQAREALLELAGDKTKRRRAA